MKRDVVMDYSKTESANQSISGICNTKTTRRPALAVAFACLIIALLAAGCSKARATAPPPAAPEVEVAQVEQRDVPIYNEWIGTLDGLVNADIKSQVTGYLLSKNYTEGAFVKKGQWLFQI